MCQDRLVEHQVFERPIQQWPDGQLSLRGWHDFSRMKVNACGHVQVKVVVGGAMNAPGEGEPGGEAAELGIVL